MIVNCDGCGRDMSVSPKTYDPYKVNLCRRCTPRQGQAQISDMKDRHASSAIEKTGAPREDEYDDESRAD